MRKLRRLTPAMTALIAIGILLLARILTGNHATQTQWQRDARVTVVIDGDTFETETGIRVRLRGIDAPEVAHHDQKAEHYGAESTAWLRQLIDGRTVRMVIEIDEPKDRYGRTLAWVYLPDGTLLNQLALHTGHARLMDRFGLPQNLESNLRSSATDARTHLRGLWQDR